MFSRPVVIISGKTGSGKSGLTGLLEREYQFRAIRTRELLAAQAGTSDRATLLARGRELDKSTQYRWVADETIDIIGGLTEYQGVVIDHVTSPLQVQAFRRKFGSALLHVHLWASAQTLHTRYEEQLGREVDAVAYANIDHLSDDTLVVALKRDADVRINTDRCDARDTLVQVAAHLRLFTPPDVRCVDVIIGGQYGSEGKGNVVGYLAREYDVMVRVGGPNAGHTVASIDGPYTYHHLPSGSRDVTARILLGPGMTIWLDGLLKEIRECRITRERLFIDPQALIIEESDRDAEKSSVVGAIGSTGSGSGFAAARRITERGKGTVRLARDVPELAQYVGHAGAWRGNTVDRLEDAYRAGKSILLEGTQGSGLSTFHGHYSHVTSRDTNVAGCLAEAGISPSRVRKILMVIRPMPIRVDNPDGDEGRSSGPLKHETTFDAIAEWSELDADALKAAEKTSTTNRKRRVGWFEWEQFRKACALNAPTDIVLAFADYVRKSNRNARRFEQLDERTIRFIENLERVSQAPVSLINTRFPREDDGTGDLRTVIDRRTWTALRSKDRDAS
ncbi:adenylosuccinate synthetase [Rothia nasimurium]|uniref:Adenylosuccinate synthetase n=1 Tax=Luteibacter anthropi TaxID=564369 RepID=A0A7X5UAT0_9GAMM|nr:adenylosuccinate synthetase [Luteibacter anthropi]NII06955.1 adenylosuccinate synthetase [Luteibacter anthropi]